VSGQNDPIVNCIGLIMEDLVEVYSLLVSYSLSAEMNIMN